MVILRLQAALICLPFVQGIKEEEEEILKYAANVEPIDAVFSARGVCRQTRLLFPA